MLQAQGLYNKLSAKLREDLEERAKKLGRFVHYQFDIAMINPDGEHKTGGAKIYPLHYALSPITYDILDPHDKAQKKVGLVLGLKEFGAPSDAFRRMVLKEGWRGKYILDLNMMEDRDMFAYLEMHPKMEGGMFQDKGRQAKFKRIDEREQAGKLLKARQLKIDAMYVAANMSLQEIRDFSSAMGWNEFDDEVVLRDRIVAIAEETPDFFRDFIDNKNIEYRAVLQRAIDNNIIAFLPVESKFVWVSTGQAIAVLERVEGGKLLDRMVDWVLTSKNGMDIFTKIKGFLSEKAKISA